MWACCVAVCAGGGFKLLTGPPATGADVITARPAGLMCLDLQGEAAARLEGRREGGGG